MKPAHLTIILVAVSAFLAPLLGGQINVETIPMLDGLKFINPPEIPFLSHAILALPAVIALCYIVAKRKIIQVPSTTLSILWVGYVGLIVVSLLFSKFRSASIPAVLELGMVSTALFATVAGVGRRRGPRIVLQALMAGATIVALIGLFEYRDMKSIDPSWRIFASWCEPNASASLFVIALFVGIGLTITSDRVEALGTGLATILCGLALILTQSRAAFGVAAITVVIFASILLIQRQKLQIARLGGVVATLCVLFFLLGRATAASASAGATSTSAITRLTSASTAGDQSKQFRFNLWKGAPSVIRANPAGTGYGTYRYYSAASGLTTQTKLAHNTYIQQAIECNLVCPILFISFFAVWLLQMLRNAKSLPADQNNLRTAVFCAVLAILLHSAWDSDFYFFGLAFIVSILVGLGVLLAGDAVTPEFTPPTSRGLIGFVVAASFGCLIWIGQNQLSNAEFAAALQTRNTAAIQSLSDAVAGHASLDADACKLLISTADKPAERSNLARQLVNLAPSTANLRLLARIESSLGNYPLAKSSLQRALDLDPNNLSTLRLLADIQGEIHLDDMRTATLERMVGTEKTVYFQTRSLPELVETGSYEARVLLAEQSTSPTRKVDLLAPAIDGFAEYRDTTVPFVARMIKGGQTGAGGENADSVQRKLKVAQDAILSLQKAYRDLKDSAKADALDAEFKRFAEALSVTLK